ncbi:hypothetical protein L2719_17080 [Shewanella schlegeliana]|uniref:Uncharacterized protein n=1 Tax=Shewanella schlegeliana TaxID=190308 RepID=A0ABS1T365_9GAMM|nr:hypothetical protein [Shewanella schlegeliana]MBL4915238.1 hypothetical protein [Shewanella schlegeliana]MCL1111251.1 hypothetical protein [Shewanella schlegeliana]
MVSRTKDQSFVRQESALMVKSQSDELSVSDLIYFFLGLLMTALVIPNDWPAVISLLTGGRA